MCNILIVWVFEVEVAYFVTCSNTVVGVVWCGVVWCGVVWCGVMWFVVGAQRGHDQKHQTQRPAKLHA